MNSHRDDVEVTIVIFTEPEVTIVIVLVIKNCTGDSLRK